MRGFRTTGVAPPPTEIHVRGFVDTSTVVRTQAAVERAARTGLPVQRLITKIASYGDGTRSPLCVAQVNIEVAGRLVRRQAAAPTCDLAVDRVTASLPAALDRLAGHLSRPVGPPAYTDDEWPPDRAPRAIPTYGRPARHPRGLVRHKACVLAVQDPVAAALTMDLRDYDFHVFAGEPDGADCIVYRGGASGYRMATVTGTAGRGGDGHRPIEADRDPLPSLTLPEAIRRLDTGRRAFLIFAAAAVGRGSVLYRRYDGHLGLVTPVR